MIYQHFQKRQVDHKMRVLEFNLMIYLGFFCSVFACCFCVLVWKVWVDVGPKAPHSKPTLSCFFWRGFFLYWFCLLVFLKGLDVFFWGGCLFLVWGWHSRERERESTRQTKTMKKLSKNMFFSVVFAFWGGMLMFQRNNGTGKKKLKKKLSQESFFALLVPFLFLSFFSFSFDSFPSCPSIFLSFLLSFLSFFASKVKETERKQQKKTKGEQEENKKWWRKTRKEENNTRIITEKWKKKNWKGNKKHKNANKVVVS